MTCYGYFEILHVFEQNRLKVGDWVHWKLEIASGDQGNSIAVVKERGPNYIQYLKSVHRETKIYEKKLAMRQPAEIGDFVVLPIPNCDRTNTDPKTMLAKVLEIHKGYATLGIRIGRIKFPFKLEDLNVFRGKKPDWNVEDKEVVLTTAYRSTTSYSLCKCKNGCNDNNCPCRCQNNKCSTKCHPKIPTCANCPNSISMTPTVAITKRKRKASDSSPDTSKRKKMTCNCPGGCSIRSKRCKCRNGGEVCSKSCSCKNCVNL